MTLDKLKAAKLELFLQICQRIAIFSLSLFISGLYYIYIDTNDFIEFYSSAGFIFLLLLATFIFAISIIDKYLIIKNTNIDNLESHYGKFSRKKYRYAKGFYSCLKCSDYSINIKLMPSKLNYNSDISRKYYGRENILFATVSSVTSDYKRKFNYIFVAAHSLLLIIIFILPSLLQ